VGELLGKSPLAGCTLKEYGSNAYHSLWLPAKGEHAL